MSRPRHPSPGPTRTTASSTPASRRSTPSWGRAACRGRPASRSAATARAAGRRSSSGSPPRPRRRARSSPGWTCRAASTRSRRSPAASGSNGSWSSPPRRSTRAWPSVARCWPGARSTCSSSTCPAAGWPPRTSPPGSPTGSAGWRRSPGARRRSSSCSSRRACAGGLATAVAESTGLRLELARRSWIRLGRDVVGQRTEALVARNRYGPPGRRATLRILYAEGGERDACLRRDDLLHRSRPPIQPPPSTNGPIAMRLLHLHRPHLPLELARARASEPLPARPARPGRPAVGSGPGHRREPGSPGAGRPAGDAARERPSARP